MKLKALLLFAILSLFFIACGQQVEKPAAKADLKPDTAAGKQYITMATTTSTFDSGLLDYLNPLFTAKTGIDVRVVSLGTGAAIRAGENGDADLILVHDTEGEKKFVADGFGIDRREVFYNDFILLGPPDNPAGILDTDTITEALAKIAADGATFISRGDDSGTHRREQTLWRETGLPLEEKADTIVSKGEEVILRYVKPTGEWYLSIGQGMGAALNMAHEKGAYLIADRGTYLSYKSKLDLLIVSQGDDSLRNQYGIIAVNPEKHPGIKYDLAMKYIDWLCSDEGQQAVAAFRQDGEILFHPDYKAG
jgi:tungstate transport system substrate-binding protein